MHLSLAWEGRKGEQHTVPFGDLKEVLSCRASRRKYWLTAACYGLNVCVCPLSPPAKFIY
jgi:hypothetical protein